MPNSAKQRAPKKETTPHAVHIIKHRPIEPEYLRAAVDETKIPEPIITLIMTLTAARRPRWRLRPTPSSLPSLVEDFISLLLEDVTVVQIDMS